MSKMTIIEGNSNDKDNVRAYMVKGEPGVSPTIGVSKEDGVTTLTIEDAEGTHTATIADGDDLVGGVPTDGVIGFDGEAADIPDGYEVLDDINLVKSFNTIAEMKAAETLQAGDTCQTLGYYSANDGGAGLYKIVDNNTLVDDGGNIHILNNVLRAKLIIEGNTINAKQFGAKGDGIHDDTNNLQKMLDIATNNITYNLNIETPNFEIPRGKYLITLPLQIKGRCNIDGNGAILTTNTSINSFISYYTNTTIGYSNIKNLTFDGNLLAKKGIITTGCLAQIENCYFNNLIENGIISFTSDIGGNVKIKNCKFYEYINQSGELDYSNVSENCIPIEVHTADTIIENCITVNYKIHINIHSYPCFINMCHGYNFKNKLLNSCYIKTQSSGVFVHIEQTECDTLESFINSGYTNCNYYLSNCHYFIFSGSDTPVHPIFYETEGTSALTVTGLMVETNGYNLALSNFTSKPRYINCTSDVLTKCGLYEGFGTNAMNFNLSGYVAPGDIAMNKYERLNDLYIINTFIYFNSGAKTISSDYTLGVITGYTATFRKRVPINITSNGEQKLGILQIDTDGTVKLLKNDLTITSVQISIVISSL